MVSLPALMEAVERDLEGVAEQECEREDTEYSTGTAIYLVEYLIAGAEEALVVLEDARAEEHVKTKRELASTFFFFARLYNLGVMECG